MADKTFIVKIKRQQRPDEAVRWEEFELRYRPHMNVIICLRDIAEKPFTREGRESSPVSYEANCLEEVCGACAMLINGKPRQACTALVDELEKPIRLEPLTKFPWFATLKSTATKCSTTLNVPSAGFRSTVPTTSAPVRACPPRSRKRLTRSRAASPAETCLEICPKVNENDQFVGAIVSQVRLFNMHPTGAMHSSARLDALMGPGGIEDWTTRRTA